jgi:hypothetical protein
VRLECCRSARRSGRSRPASERRRKGGAAAFGTLRPHRVRRGAGTKSRRLVFGEPGRNRARRARPMARARVACEVHVRGSAHGSPSVAASEASGLRRMVSPVGIEPTTNRLRVPRCFATKSLNPKAESARGCCGSIPKDPQGLPNVFAYPDRDSRKIHGHAPPPFRPTMYERCRRQLTECRD